MTSPETPKFSGPHRRWGRPFGDLSPTHATVAVVLAVLAFAIFLSILLTMK